MMNSPVEEVKNRLNITDVIGTYLKLQKAGANFRALCPFHKEKTPSFFVSPLRQVWKCFGCGAHGDLFNFVMQMEGVEFRDALRTLAQKAGVELQSSPFLARLQTERKGLLEVAELATQFFEKQLESSPSGLEARAYLVKRGLTEETIKKWRLGYAPESARALLDFLLSRGYSSHEVWRTGLLVSSEGAQYDRFRSRIMFPVCDLHSQVIGFGGRIFGGKAQDKEIAKYLNTSNTLLYDKSRVLYGLDLAKLAIRQENSAMLVEGYMDAILASQAGLEQVVAVSGTALTILHLKTLKRYSENLLLAFDMDIGGEQATWRGIDLAIGEGFQLKVLPMPEGFDPADLAAENPELLRSSVENAKSIFDFCFERAFAKFNKDSPDGKREIAKLLLPMLKKIPNRIEQAHWAALLAKELQVKEEYVHAELQKIKERETPHIFAGGGEPAASLPQEPKTRKGLLEERVLMLLLETPSLLSSIGEEKMHFFSASTQEILEGFKKNPQLDFSHFQGIFEGEVIEFLKQIALQAEVETWEKGDEQDNVLELERCLLHLEYLFLRERLDVLARDIKAAEEEKDPAKLQALLEQFQSLSRNLHMI